MKNIKEYLINSIDISIQKNFKHKYLKRHINKMIDIFINDKNISEAKKTKLFSYIISTLDINKQYAEELYKKLLNRNTKFSYSELIFIIQYTTYLAYIDKKFDVNTNAIRKGYEDYECPNLLLKKQKRDSKREVLAAYNEETNTIEIYSEFLSKFLKSKEGSQEILVEDILDLIKTINHEIFHSQQIYELYHNFISESAFNGFKVKFISDLYKNENFDEYKKNYSFKEFEIQSEIESFISTQSIIKKYFINNKEEIISKLEIEKNNLEKENALSFQTLPDGRRCLIDDYNIISLIKLVNKPLCEKFEILKLFFDSTGKLKTEKQLLKEYISQTDDIKKSGIYNQFFVYLFIHNNEEIVEKELLFYKANLIAYYLEKEINYCYIIDSLRNDISKQTSRISLCSRMKNANSIIKLRIKRIEKYLEFLYNFQKQYFNDKEDENTKNTRRILKDLLSRGVETLKKYGFKGGEELLDSTTSVNYNRDLDEVNDIEKGNKKR